MHNQFTEWQKYATHLSDHTPLSERQAQVLALKKVGHTVKDISNKLDCQPEAVEDLWDNVIEQWDHAQNLGTIMGPHPWNDDEVRKENEFDDSPWMLLASGGMNYPDKERTRIELELYLGGTEYGANRYLLIEREIIDNNSYSTKTTEHRSAHRVSGLHDHLYATVDTVDELYLRVALLIKASIDPDSKYAPLSRDVIGRELTDTERTEALEKALPKIQSITSM